MSTAPPVRRPSRAPGPPAGLPAPVPGTAVDPTAPAVPVRTRRREALDKALSGTPGRLRVAAVLSVLGSLIFGLLGGSAFQAWGGALDDARADAAQLVRVQAVQNDLVKADAAAAAIYLAGGVSATNAAINEATAANRAAYDEAIADAARRLAQPSAASDTEAMEKAIEGLARYTSLVSQAQANNRFGLQVGAAYQRQAGEVLRSQIVPALEQVSHADQRRVAAAYEAANNATIRLIGAAVLALVLLGGAQLWLARRTHRVINVPLAVGTLAVVLATGLGVTAVNASAEQANRVATTSYAHTVALASGRTAAFDAKAQEAFGLIARGNAAAAERIATARIATATEQLASVRAVDVSDLFAAWAAEHAAVRAADDAGSWAAARDAALTTSSEAFEVFDARSAEVLTAKAAQVDDELGSARNRLVAIGWFTLACGLIAAGAAYAGIAQRMGEYR